jgi:hypothetical protein
MATWTIKSQTNESDLALKIVEDQRNKGYNAWIEDENGAAVDEQSLKTTRFIVSTYASRLNTKGKKPIAA